MDRDNVDEMRVAGRDDARAEDFADMDRASASDLSLPRWLALDAAFNGTSAGFLLSVAAAAIGSSMPADNSRAVDRMRARRRAWRSPRASSSRPPSSSSHQLGHSLRGNEVVTARWMRESETHSDLSDSGRDSCSADSTILALNPHPFSAFASSDGNAPDDPGASRHCAISANENSRGDFARVALKREAAMRVASELTRVEVRCAGILFGWLPWAVVSEARERQGRRSLRGPGGGGGGVAGAARLLWLPGWRRATLASAAATRSRSRSTLVRSRSRDSGAVARATSP
mmetsp:Transcript_15523/g.48581  ORF Transcript_15523/g.48581 Transcript_15523/m.48581 type:complete len:287 (+) Transcript_15523:4112-4972(+)